jgi:uncharacterized integral membrane protein (TIGR00698 family)
MDAQNHLMPNRDTLVQLGDTPRRILFIFCVAFCLTPYAGPASALLLGLVVAQLMGHPYLHLNHKATHLLLQVSVVGLGFGMNLHSALQAGRQGIVLTIFSISGTLLFGYLLGRILKIDRKASFLISSGTAICGGSAIAAVSPVIKAEEKQISVALGCVFVFNAIALFVFPVIGHHLHLSQTQFGLWCAIAIHDTSSVVGAAGKYGPHALEIATTVKLARALWIIPVTFLSSFAFKNKSKKVSIPWFIGLFLIALAANTYLPGIAVISPYVVTVAKAGLTLTLFLIGAGLSRSVLSSVGFKPFLQGAVLWVAISTVSLWAILHLA